MSYFCITCSTHVKLVSTVALRLTGSRIKLLRVDGRTILNLCFRVVYFKLFELSLTSVYPLDTTDFWWQRWDTIIHTSEENYRIER